MILDATSVEHGLLALFTSLCVVACLPDDPSSGRDAAPPPDSSDTTTDVVETSVGDSSPDPDSGDASCPSVVTDGSPELRIATFNVRRLFDSTCDTGRCGDEAYEPDPEPDRVESRIGEIADGLADVEADVLLLQEIEKRSLLVRLRDALESRGREYPVITFGERGTAASLDVGVLARGTTTRAPEKYRESKELKRPDGSTARFTREFLRTDLEIEGEQLVTFVAHFKSQVDDDPELRLAEAKGAAEIVSSVARRRDDALVVLGGDLNDLVTSPPLQALRDAGLRRVGGTSTSPWSYCYRGEAEAIDHLMVAPTCGGAAIRGSGGRWGSGDCPGFVGFAGSDHGAISADFALQQPASSGD